MCCAVCSAKRNRLLAKAIHYYQEILRMVSFWQAFFMHIRVSACPSLSLHLCHFSHAIYICVCVCVYMIRYDYFLLLFYTVCYVSTSFQFGISRSSISNTQRFVYGLHREKTWRQQWMPEYIFFFHFKIFSWIKWKNELSVKYKMFLLWHIECKEEVNRMEK